MRGPARAVDVPRPRAASPRSHGAPGAGSWAARVWARRSQASDTGPPAGLAVGAARRVADDRSARLVPLQLRRLISGATLVLGGTMVGQACGFAFNAVGAHALGPARYGVLAASMALLSFVIPMLAAVQAVASRKATSLVARRELGKAVPLLRHYGLRLTCGALALSAVAAAASGWLSGLFHLGSPWLVVIVGATIPCYVAGHLLGGLLQGAERFGRFALESVVEGLAKAVLGVIAMGLLWGSVLSGMAAVGMSSAVGLVTYLLLTLPLLARGRLAPPLDAPAMPGEGAAASGNGVTGAAGGEPGVVRYSVTALATYGLLALMLSSDTLIAKHYLSDHQAGLYAGISLTGKIAYFAASSLFVVVFPIFSRHHDEGIGSGRWILAAAGMVCAVAGAVVILFAVEPAWVVGPLLGDRYRAAEGYVPWMAAVFGLYALGYLVSTYLLARKSRGVIAVLGAALVVQFAGFFAFHSTMTRLMGVLAVAFAVAAAGGIVLIMLGERQPGGPRDRTAPLDGSGPRHTRTETSAAAPPAGAGNHGDAATSAGAMAEAGTGGAARVPAEAAARIVSEVTRRVGSVPVLLAGSRAIGTAHAESDYDVVAVLPLPRIPRAAPRLAEAAQVLSASFGVPVSVNPVPAFRLRRPGGSLFAGKLRAEAVVLAAPPDWSLRRQPLTGVTTFAACSALLSAVRSLLEVFDTSVMAGGPTPAQARGALRKAALHIAQVRLLRSGLYASNLDEALTRLRCAPPGWGSDAPGSELTAALISGLMAASAVDGFVRLRQCLLGQLAEIDAAPFRLPTAKALVRNAQYAALASLRGRNRWRVALRRASVEGTLAATQVALLRALEPGAADGLNAGQFRLALQTMPVPVGEAELRSWEGVRDVALAEWCDAHPLVGLLA
jgi:O-antigen/teichoic acid export membrane protein